MNKESVGSSSPIFLLPTTFVLGECGIPVAHSSISRFHPEWFSVTWPTEVGRGQHPRLFIHLALSSSANFPSSLRFRHAAAPRVAIRDTIVSPLVVFPASIGDTLITCQAMPPNRLIRFRTSNFTLNFFRAPITQLIDHLLICSAKVINACLVGSFCCLQQLVGILAIRRA